jgi:hypothetical protein
MFRLVLIVLVMASVTVSCAAKPEKFLGPNGRTAYTLACNGWANCYRTAAVLCKDGYAILGQHSDTQGFSTFRSGTTFYSTQTLAFECK